MDAIGISLGKTVLMLDNEPLMVDRRIMLEAQTLVEAGYRVVLATKASAENQYVEFNRGVEIRRFPLFENRMMDPLTKVQLATQQIVDWIYAPGSLKIERLVRRKMERFPRILQSVAYSVVCPPVFAATVGVKFPLIKKVLGRAYQPLIFIIMFRITYLKPYFTVLKYKIVQRILGKKIQTDSMFDPFCDDIINFAVNDLKPDFVHAHDLPNLPLGLEIARRQLIPLVYDAHELYPQQFFSSAERKTELAYLERRLIPNVDAVIAVNKQCKDVLLQTYPFIRDIVILSNATEIPKGYDPSKKLNLWHDRFDLDASVQIMVFQGGINPVRHIDHLIFALTDIPEHIHIGFITFKKDVPYYRELSDRLGVSHRIHYILEIPWDEVIQWLAASDVGIMPYQPNNLNARISSPNKLFEFVVAGLPIIGSSELENVNSAIETYGLGVSHLLRDVDSYVDAINTMFDIQQAGPERFKANVLAARPFFSWENEAPRLVDLYKRLVHL